MNFISGHIYHVYNQGNNKEPIFLDEENYLFFLKKIKKEITPHAHVLAWCLMPNHYHLLIRVKDNYMIEENSGLNNSNKVVNPLNRAIGTMQSSYTQAINKKFNRSGSIFRSRAKSKSFEVGSRDYDINCFHYIHQNPVRAGIVRSVEDWEYSSFKDYSGLRNGKLCNIDLGRELFSIPVGFEEMKKQSQQFIPDDVIRSLF